MRAMVIVAVLLLGWSAVNAQEAPAQVPGAVTVNVLQARYLYEQGALFVDVRPQREWLWGHVNGAVQLGLADEFKSLKQPDCRAKSPWSFTARVRFAVLVRRPPSSP